jgi:PAS domain S-box-containing protein
MKKSQLNIFKVQRDILVVVLFSIFLFFFFGWVIYQNKKNVQTAGGWVLHTYSVIKSIESVNALITEKESLLQTYLISHDPEKEKQIQLLQVQAKEKVDQVRLLINDNPEQKNNLEKLYTLLRENKIFQDQLIQDSKKSITPSSEMVLKTINSKPDMSTKSLLLAMVDIERNLVKGRIIDFERSYRQSLSIGIAGCIISFLLIIVVLYHVNKGIALRKEASAESHFNELKYKSLIENAGAVMFTTDSFGNMQFVNRKASQLTGYSIDELMGNHFSILVDPDWVETITLNYIEQYKNGVEETLIEFPIITKNKETKWVEQSAVLLQADNKLKGFQCIVRDISDKKIMQMELEESALTLKKSQKMYQLVLDNTPSIVYIKDCKGRYLMINKRFRELFNVTDEKVLNKSNFEFNNMELSIKIREIEEKIIETKKPVEIEELRDSSKGPIDLLSIKFPLLDNDNNVIGICGISTEITEKIVYQKQLIAARQDAENAKMLQEQFLANMSHEIRTPMNGINGMINLLLETPLNSQQKEFAVIVKRSVNNLLVIINDILDFSKIKAGKLTIEKIEFDCREILNNIRAMFAHRVEKKGISLYVNIEKDVPSILIGDPYRLNQILVNLIGNAIKFTESGQIVIDITIKNKKQKKVIILFSIKDTGVGIAAENIGNLFESFSQATADTARKYGGTGLGLSISKQLTQLQGGTIAVKSELGVGSEFSFELPYGYEENENNEQFDFSLEFDYKTAFSGKRFLVAEDNEVNQKVISYVLEKVGIAVDIAENGSEAIGFLKVNPTYDLIIMDLQMPVLDGYSTTNYIRRIMQLNIPILAMTATAMKGEQSKCLQIGMNDYMSKPFEFADLYRRIYKLLAVHDFKNHSLIKIAV